jgi:hypothetical protein
MILLTFLTTVLFIVLSLAATIKAITDDTLSDNSTHRADVVHHAEEPERGMEVFRLREQPVLLYQSLHNLYNKTKP